MDSRPLTKKWFLPGIAIALTLIIYCAGSVLTPFIISLFLAYILDPLVDRLEETGLPRTVAVLLFLCFLLLVFFIGMLFLIPTIKLQIENAARNLPEYVRTLQEMIMPWMEKLSNDPEQLKALAQETMLKMGNLPLKAMSSVAGFFWNAVSGFVNMAVAAINLVIIPVATFYLLRDIDTIKEKAYRLIPLESREYILYLLNKLHLVLTCFLRGQMTVVAVLSAIYCVGLYLVGIPLSIPIGLMAGLTSIVPYLGLMLGIAPALILGFLQFHDLYHPLMVGLVFGLAQALEGMVLTPKIVGDRLGLHPVVIMFSILLGGRLFGFTGILLAVPAAAGINVFLSEWLESYKESDAFLGSGAVQKKNHKKEI